MRLKYRDYASDFNNRKNYYASMGLGSASSYTGSASQNVAMLNWMKSHGYKTGTLSANKGLHLVGEDGKEIGVMNGQLVEFGGGETVFNNKMTEQLWNFAQNPTDFMKNLVQIPDTTKSQNTSLSSSVDVGGVTITMNGVNDVDTFSKQMREALANNVQTQKMIKSMMYKDGIEFKKYK